MVAPSTDNQTSNSEDTSTIPNEEPTNQVTPENGNALTDIPSEPVKNTGEKTTFHTVVDGETLYRIAMKYYQSKSGIEIIKQANQIKGNDIHNGQKLIIPLD